MFLLNTEIDFHLINIYVVSLHSYILNTVHKCEMKAKKK